MAITDPDHFASENLRLSEPLVNADGKTVWCICRRLSGDEWIAMPGTEAEWSERCWENAARVLMGALEGVKKITDSHLW